MQRAVGYFRSIWKSVRDYGLTVPFEKLNLELAKMRNSWNESIQCILLFRWSFKSREFVTVERVRLTGPHIAWMFYLFIRIWRVSVVKFHAQMIRFQSTIYTTLDSWLPSDEIWRVLSEKVCFSNWNWIVHMRSLVQKGEKSNLSTFTEEPKSIFNGILEENVSFKTISWTIVFSRNKTLA